MNYEKLLTILIPLFGRDNCTDRLLKYFDKLECPFHIYIADGQVPDARHIIDKYPNLPLTYYHYGEDLNVSYFITKLRKSLNAITTPFTLMMDNDDFVSINGLKYGVDFLIKNSDYSSYRGRMNKSYTDKVMYRNELDINDESAMDRVFNLVKVNRNAGWQDLGRTYTFQILFNFLDKCGDNNDYQLIETFSRYWKTIFGKLHRNMSVHYYYHVLGPSIARSVIIRVVDWVSDNRFEKSIAIYVSGMCNALKYMQPELDLYDIKHKFCSVFIGEIYELNKKQIDESTIQHIIKNSEYYDQFWESEKYNELDNSKEITLIQQLV